MPFVGEQLQTNYTAITALGATTRLGSINATGRGTISIADGGTSATATITAVVVARTMLRHLGSTVTSDNTWAQGSTRVELTNTTTITATVGTIGGGARTLTVGYEYTEFTA